jgi:LysM repeat protein
MKKVLSICFIVVGLLLAGFISRGAVQLQVPTASDLIVAVNSLRANNGLKPLEVNISLMAAAQNQAEYLASLGGSNIVNGHQGPDGSLGRDRARAAGYQFSQGVEVVECWAVGNTQTSLNTIIYDQWGDQAHMDVMLHKYGKDVGAGVVEKDGTVYYILDVGTLWGVSSVEGAPASGTPPAIKPTQNKTPQVVPVLVSTPKPDGSISHLVQTGQALWSIAIAYGVTVKQLQVLNNLSENARIYAGETLKIRLVNTPTPTPTITPTPRIPTRTPIPPQPIGTALPNNPGLSAVSSAGGIDRTTLGLVLILVCGLGLVLVILGVLRRERK